MQVTIVRLKTNNVPFLPHGVICYPLRKNSEAQRPPWYQFEEMPFVVMMFKDKLGMVHEATVDMEKLEGPYIL